MTKNHPAIREGKIHAGLALEFIDENGGCPSRVELDAGTVDERLPLFAFRIHELRERFGVAAHRLDARASYPRLKVRILSDLDQRVTELLANIRRKSSRTDQPIQLDRTKSGNPVSAMVGMSGSSFKRPALRTASIFSRELST